MIRDKPLHNFFFEYDRDRFFSNLDTFCTPWIDVCVILHLARCYQPRAFLEIGTHRGVTTRILADRFPDMKITTVDPGDQVEPERRPSNQAAEFLPQDEIGELVCDRANVEIIKKPFGEIDWSGQSFEMIFVDGNHDLQPVLEDSRLALKLLTDPGVIVWHDYNNVKDVNTALDQLNLNQEIVSLHNTWVAYLDTH